ncbi:MAG: type II secretion system protein M [Gammaproteobacteria bacterium]|nr:type II secretion system protein M [Gammaproteobacteria bacterium]
MIQWLNNGQEWFASREKREQYIIAVVAVALVAWLGFLLILEPASVKQDQVKRQIQQVRTQATNMQQQLNTLQRQLQNNPNEELRVRSQQLETRSRRLQQQLNTMAEFVEPQQLLEWMQALISGPDQSGNNSVTLISFNTAAPRPFIQGATGGSILQHNVNVELEGSFFAVRDYLQRIEDLPFGFYWQEIDYQVDAYPNARVRLRLYTLSEANIRVVNQGGRSND